MPFGAPPRQAMYASSMRRRLTLIEIVTAVIDGQGRVWKAMTHVE